jgi:dephospho-CoA kinase
MIITVTGRIGSGKTTFVNMFKRYDVNIIDADKIGHELLENKIIKNKIKKAFGKNVFIKNTISRKKLADVAFKDVNRLNKIVHPYLIAEIKKRIIKNKINIIDAALYYELRLGKISNFVVLVRAGKSKILRRKVNKERFIALYNKQREPENPDVIIKNNKSRLYLAKECLKIWWKINENCNISGKL